MFFHLLHRCWTVFRLILGFALVRLMNAMGLRRIWWTITRNNTDYRPLNQAILWRKLFESLGPTFIKFGQIIASSPGLFPTELSEEFEHCLDRVPAFSGDTALQIIERELNCPPQEVFSLLDPVPIAAASIAQVHGATLIDGTSCVIKVQRPGIDRVVEIDLWFMRAGAWWLNLISRHARLANVVGIVDDFSCTIHEELDFRLEADHMGRFNEIMAQHAITTAAAPKVYEQYTTQRLLVMERFDGFKADDIARALALGVDTERFLREGLRAWLLTVLLHGFFHGDVHAGNLMFLPSRNQVGFLDFGIIGQFDESQRDHVLRYILSFGAEDFIEVANTIVAVGSVREDVDIELFAKDLERIYRPLFTQNIAQIDYGRFVPEITRNALQFGVTLPREFLLIIKQLLYFDRYAKLAAPKLNVFSDLYLVDFLFTPSAAQAGIDVNQIAGLLIQLQNRYSSRSNPTSSE